MSESSVGTLTFEGLVPKGRWGDNCFENQLFYLLEINALAGLLIDKSKGWSLKWLHTLHEKTSFLNCFPSFSKIFFTSRLIFPDNVYKMAGSFSFQAKVASRG